MLQNTGKNSKNAAEKKKKEKMDHAHDQRERKKTEELWKIAKGGFARDGFG